MSIGHFQTRSGRIAGALTTVLLGAGVIGAAAAGAVPTKHHGKPHPSAPPVEVEIHSPEPGHRAGIGSKGWFVDLEARYRGGLNVTGFTAEQLTGPGVHNNVAPFPGTFSAGQDDRLPGLIVLDSTTQTKNPDGTPTNLAGAGQNLANLFNLTGVTDRTPTSTEIWDTWIVGAPLFGHNTRSTVYVAVAADKNHDGVYNDAPAVVPDADHDGDVDARDLAAFGIASNVAASTFTIVD